MQQPHQRSRAPLPNGTAVRTSAHHAHGTPRGRLRNRSVQHPFTAVSAVGLDLGDVIDLCVGYAPLLRPGEAFSHTTAALLFGVPLPRSIEARPLHVLSPDGVAQARTRGIVGHRRARPFTVTHVRGIPVVSPELAWLQLSGSLTREDLTAAGDFMVTGARVGFQRLVPHTSLPALDAAFAAREVRRGREAARWALDRIRVGADSRPETLLRLCIVAAGFPEPSVNVPVAIGDGAVWHPDLSYPEWRIAIEYQGAPHWDVHAWKRDTERRERFEDAGWRSLFVTSSDLFASPASFLDRLGRTIADRRG
mgnify:CR=1 FL=1